MGTVIAIASRPSPPAALSTVTTSLAPFAPKIRTSRRKSRVKNSQRADFLEVRTARSSRLRLYIMRESRRPTSPAGTAAKPGRPALSLDGRAAEARRDRSGRTWSSKRSSANSSGSHEASERLDHRERGRKLGLRPALPAQLELVLCRQSSVSSSGIRAGSSASEARGADPPLRPSSRGLTSPPWMRQRSPLFASAPRKATSWHGGRHHTSIPGVSGTPDPPVQAVSAQPQGAKCAWQESNLRPRAPEARALSPELQARGFQSSLAPGAVLLT